DERATGDGGLGRVGRIGGVGRVGGNARGRRDVALAVAAAAVLRIGELRGRLGAAGVGGSGHADEDLFFHGQLVAAHGSPVLAVGREFAGQHVAVAAKAQPAADRGVGVGAAVVDGAVALGEAGLVD